MGLRTRVSRVWRGWFSVGISRYSGREVLREVEYWNVECGSWVVVHSRCVVCCGPEKMMGWLPKPPTRHLRGGAAGAEQVTSDGPSIPDESKTRPTDQLAHQFRLQQYHCMFPTEVVHLLFSFCLSFSGVRKLPVLSGSASSSHRRLPDTSTIPGWICGLGVIHWALLSSLLSIWHSTWAAH